MPKASPFSSTKISGPFSVHYIFIASYTMCYSWSVFVFVLVWFILVCCNNLLDPSFFCFGGRHAPFSLPRTLWFHSYSSASVLLLLALPLVFVLFRNFKFFFLVMCVKLSDL